MVSWSWINAKKRPNTIVIGHINNLELDLMFLLKVNGLYKYRNSHSLIDLLGIAEFCLLFRELGFPLRIGEFFPDSPRRK